MRDRYQPGHLLVLPSGRRVVIERMNGGYFQCRYEAGTLGHGGMRSGVLLTRQFCDRHALHVERPA